MSTKYETNTKRASMSYLIPLEPSKYFSTIDIDGIKSYVIKNSILDWTEKHNCEVFISIITPDLKKVFSKHAHKFKCDMYDDEDIDDSVFIEMHDRKQYSMFKMRWEA